MSNFNHLTNDLLNFIDDLRVAGYNIGLEQFITVQNLILALTAQGRLPAKLADLQTFLAPILCHSPKEQEDFAQRFADWVRRVGTLSEEVQPQPVLTLETELKSISRGMTFWKWTWRFVLVLVLILVPMELFKLNQDISELQTPQLTKPVDQTTLSKPGVVEPPVSSELLVPPTLPPQTTLSQNIWELKWSIGLTLSLPLLLFLSWWLWWQYQVHRFLARKTVSTQPDLQQFLVQGHQHQLFSSVPLQRVAQGLRKHFTVPTSHLDVKTTLAKTIQAGGWFTPVMGTVQTSPEYLVLIDRTTFRDHQAEFINTLVKRLEAEEVFITRYYFDTDPRRCYPEQPQLPPLTLPELAGRYPQHRLLIFTDGQGFIHPITGELAGWLTQLSDWSQRTLFTLEAPQQWGYREKLLEDEAGFLVLPANEAGLTVLVEYINEQRKADLASSPEAPFPEMLIDRPRRYLERHAPEAETVTELLAQVRQFLGEKDSYDWFSACAVYPELRWQLTLYLGEALQVLNEERLAKLAQLPWFRYGYMPNWLREKLVKDLSLAQEKKIREALQVLLLTAMEGGTGEFRLEVAREQKKSLLNLAKRLLPILSKEVDKRSALRDYIFLTFMKSGLVVEIPKVLKNLLAGTKSELSVEIPKVLKNLVGDYSYKESASFWRRFWAFLFDFVFSMFFAFLVYFFVYFFVAICESLFIRLFGHSPISTSSIEDYKYKVELLLVIWWFYSVITETSSKQATFGKMEYCIKVTNLNGKRVSLVSSLIRNLIKFSIIYISYIVITMSSSATLLPMLAILSLLWIELCCNGLANIISGCLVVRVKEDEKILNLDVNPFLDYPLPNLSYSKLFKILEPVDEVRITASLMDLLVLFQPMIGLGVIVGQISSSSLFIISTLFFYGVVMESSPTQATLGKIFTGIKVTDLHGNRLSFVRALFRNLLKFPMTIIFFVFLIGITLLSALDRNGNVINIDSWDTVSTRFYVTISKMNLHNRITGCVVAKRE